MFKQKLTRVVNNIDGAIGCVLMGFDGISIDSYWAQDFPQMQAVAVELSNMLDKFRRQQIQDIGDIYEVSITSGEITTLARVVAEDYLLILALSEEADVGRGQTMLRLISPFLEKEMM
jgi:hypothetical protein